MPILNKKDDRGYCQKSPTELKGDLININLKIKNIKTRIKTLKIKNPIDLNWKMSSLNYKIYDWFLTKEYIYELIEAKNKGIMR